MRFARTALLTLLLAILCCASSLASSFQTFVTVYAQVTNDIALLHSIFEGTPEQKVALARLYASRDAVLDPLLADEKVLDELVMLLGNFSEYDLALDETANNARETVLARDIALGERIEILPPSQQADRARSNYNDLSADRNALLNADEPAGIAAKLAPYGQRLNNISELADRASVMQRPKSGRDNLRAQVNGKKFNSGRGGRNSPNTFAITEPDPLYSEIYCRVFDTEKVISFTLPVITSEAGKHEIHQGLATLTYTEDVFATNAVPQSATNGTFWVQSVKDEIYGIFSCEGPGFQIKDGRFRIKTKQNTF